LEAASFKDCQSREPELAEDRTQTVALSTVRRSVLLISLPFFILALVLPVQGKEIGASVLEIGLFFSAFSLWCSAFCCECPLVPELSRFQPVAWMRSSESQPHPGTRPGA
jgi:hypothetical protein